MDRFLFLIQRRRATRRKNGEERIANRRKERRADARVYRRIRSARIGRVLMKDGGHGGEGRVRGPIFA